MSVCDNLASFEIGINGNKMIYRKNSECIDCVMVCIGEEKKAARIARRGIAPRAGRIASGGAIARAQSRKVMRTGRGEKVFVNSR